MTSKCLVLLMANLFIKIRIDLKPKGCLRHLFVGFCSPQELASFL